MFHAKLGNEPGAPVIPLGTERKGRAEKKVEALRLHYPDAHLTEEPATPGSKVAQVQDETVIDLPCTT